MVTDWIPPLVRKKNNKKNKVSERATLTEIQKICMLGAARILRKVLSVWTELLTFLE